MSPLPNWCRWLLGSFTLLTLAGIVVLVPAVQDARNLAKKSADK